MKINLPNLKACILNLSKIEQAFLAFFLLVFCLLLIENTLYGSFNILNFRSVDDYGFHIILRAKHEKLLRLDILDLLEINNNGYGWLFWIIHVIITFPFFLIGLLGYEAPLITVARNISLFFMAASCVNLFLISKKYTKDKYIPYFILLCFISFPYFAYAALSFRTIAQMIFFSSLAFYLCIKNDHPNKQNLKYIALAVAACIATKPTGVIILPVIGIILGEKLNWEINRPNLEITGYFIKILSIATILLSNPSLVLAVFKWDIFAKYYNTLKEFSIVANSNYGGNYDFWFNFSHSIYGPFMYPFILFFLLLATFLKGINKREFIFIGLFLIFSTLLTVHIFRPNTGSITNYLSAISFLVPLGLIYFEKLKRKYLILTIFITLNVFLNLDNIKHRFFEYFTKYKDDQELIIEQQKLKQIIDREKHDHVLLLTDISGPMIFSPFNKKASIITALNNYNEIPGIYDYIILRKDRISVSHSQKAQHKIQKADLHIQEQYHKSRTYIETLLSEGAFHGHYYKKIYESEHNILLRRVSI